MKSFVFGFVTNCSSLLPNVLGGSQSRSIYHRLGQTLMPRRVIISIWLPTTRKEQTTNAKTYGKIKRHLFRIGGLGESAIDCPGSRKKNKPKKKN